MPGELVLDPRQQMRLLKCDGAVHTRGPSNTWLVVSGDPTTRSNGVEQLNAHTGFASPAADALLPTKNMIFKFSMSRFESLLLTICSFDFEFI